MKKVTIPQLPVATTIGANDNLIVQQGTRTKRIKYETLENNIESRDIGPVSILYAALDTLKTNSELVAGRKYLITDATDANIQLIVEAIAVNAIHTDAKSPEFPQDIIEYDFVNDLIVWRWDTINDISVAQDLRNLIGLTIGTGCRNIHIGANSGGTIGNNCQNVEFGEGCTITLAATSVGVIFGNSVSGIFTQPLFNKTFGNDVSEDFSSATFIYSVQYGDIILSEAGSARLVYIDGSNNLTNVLATS